LVPLLKTFFIFKLSGCLAKGCFTSVGDGGIVVSSLETAYIFEFFGKEHFGHQWEPPFLKNNADLIGFFNSPSGI
jgi:hypothetical protein